MTSRRRSPAAVDPVRVPIVASGLFLAHDIRRQCASQRYFFSLGRPGACPQSHKTPADGPLVTGALLGRTRAAQPPPCATTTWPSSRRCDGT